MSHLPMTLPNETPTNTFNPPSGEYERFLYSVSHDLQEPLRMISSFLKLLEVKAGNDIAPEAKEFLDYSLMNAEKMKKMIYALVDLSRIGRSSEQAGPVQLTEILGDLEKMYGVDLQRESGTVSYDALPEVWMQPSHVIQLFKVLFQNALDNVSTRPLAISITAKPKGEFVEIAFKDNGVGMKSVYFDKVFELFKKVDQGSDKIGAGLAIAREIVRRNGGEISLSSEEGEGTELLFTLPMNV